MPLYRMQVASRFDSDLPRDKLVNTLHFDDAGATTNPAQLCADLALIYDANWFYPPQPQIVVSAYLVGVPGDPVAVHTRNTTPANPSTRPREIALCLSYYSETNTPRRRGRIYLPMTGVTEVPQGRPSNSIMQRALDLAGLFSALGGADVDWVVYSRTDESHHDVSHAWVDNEWDTVRSRGLRATTRLQTAVSG